MSRQTIVAPGRVPVQARQHHAAAIGSGGFGVSRTRAISLRGHRRRPPSPVYQDASPIKTLYQGRLPGHAGLPRQFRCRDNSAVETIRLSNDRLPGCAQSAAFRRSGLTPECFTIHRPVIDFRSYMDCIETAPRFRQASFGASSLRSRPCWWVCPRKSKTTSFASA